MQQSTHLLLVSILFSALLPMTVWGYGFNDYRVNSSHRSYAGSAGGNQHSNSLRLQTGTSADGYYLRAYLEGLHPDDIQIYLRRNRLVLQVSRGERYGSESSGAGRASRWQMRFRKQLRLPYDADVARMTKSTNNGVMEIYIPRRNHYPQIIPPATR